MDNFNVSTFLFINQFAGKNNILDIIFISAAEVMPYIFMLVLVYLWFSSSMEKRRSAFNSGLSVLLGMITSYVISLFYYHPRPFVENLGTQLIPHAPDSSFPSDHTTFIFSIAVMLLFNKATRKVGFILFVLSIISGLSRVYGGVHFPLDILGAMLVAVFSSVIVFNLQYKTNALFNLLVKIIPNRSIKNDSTSPSI